MTSDELYNKYLEEEFREQDGTYYCNPKTNEVFLDSQIVDNLIYYDLYHVFARVNRYGYSDRFIYDIKGNPLYLKFSDFFNPICGLKGYYVMQDRKDGSCYYLYDYDDNLIFSYKSDEVNYGYPTLYKYPHVISLKDGGDYIIHEEPLKDEETVLKISKNNIEEIKAVFTKFGIANSFIEELENKNNLEEINYNDYFLVLKAQFLDGDIMPILVVNKSRENNRSKILAYNPAGLETQFNKDRCLIRDKSLIYFDNNGQVINEFFRADYKNWLNIDKTMATLITIEKMQLKFKKKKLFCYINDRKYELSSCTYCSGRLLVKNKDGLYGYLDSEGKEVIKPQFELAHEFYRGYAGTEDGDIDINGNLFNKEILKNYSDYKSGLAYCRSYDGTLDPNKYILGISASDYKNFLVITRSKKGILKRKERTFYYIDYKTKEIIKTTYQPVRQYYDFMIFYIHKNFYWQEGYYLFAKNTKSYIWLANKNDNLAFFDDYFTLNGKTYYVADRIIDLGSFQLTSRIKKDNRKLLTKDEFLASKKYNDDIDAKTREDELNRQLAIQKIQETKARLQKIEQKIIALQEEREKLIINMSHEAKIRIGVPADFKVEKNGIKRVNSKYIYSLEKYDLMFYDFTGFDVSNLDFSGTNAAINPQTIYNKDMRNGNFCNVNFLSYDFSNVDISGAIFNNDFVICYQEKILEKKLTK